MDGTIHGRCLKPSLNQGANAFTARVQEHNPSSFHNSPELLVSMDPTAESPHLCLPTTPWHEMAYSLIKVHYKTSDFGVSEFNGPPQSATEQFVFIKCAYVENRTLSPKQSLIGGWSLREGESDYYQEQGLRRQSCNYHHQLDISSGK